MAQESDPVYQPVDARRLHESVVQQITRQIVSRAFKAGETLPSEPEMAKHFGVSRMVIREAVRVLAAKGLVAVKHGSGMRVQPADRWNHLDPLVLLEEVGAGRADGLLGELLEMRRILETEAAALAAARRTPQDCALLSEALDRMAGARADPDSYTQWDIQFHDGIVAAARNRLLREALNPVVKVQNRARFISIRRPGALEQSLSGHREIYGAIEQGDATAAREAMHRHVLQFEGDFRAVLGATRGVGLLSMLEGIPDDTSRVAE